MKVLLISNQSIENLGGVENYNRKLIKILNKNNINYKNYILTNDKKNYSYYEYIKKFNFIKTSVYLFKYRKRSRKLLYKEINFSDYDLIIDSTYIFFKKIYKFKNYLWIQHNSPNFYYGKIFKNIFLNFLYIIYQKLSGVGDFFKAKNIVLYDEYNYNNLKNKDSNYFYCKLSSFNKEQIESFKYTKKDKIIYIGRINSLQKNISLLNKIDHEIELYGDGDLSLIKSSNIKIKNKYTNDSLMDILSKTKLALLPSNFEGFSYSAIECLSCQTPVLVMNSFPSAKTIAISKDFLAQNDNDFIKKFNKLINNKNDYWWDEVFSKCKNLSLNEFTNENFIYNWEKILNSFKNKD